MTARLTILLVTAMAIGAVAIGCGSDDSSGDSGSTTVTTSSLSKPQFVKQASAECSEERKNLLTEVTVYLAQHEKDGKPEGALIVDLAKEIILPTVEAEVEVIRSLGAPEGDEEKIEAMLAAQQKGIEEVEGLKQAKSLEEVESHFIKATKQMNAYGFTACTNSIGA